MRLEDLQPGILSPARPIPPAPMLPVALGLIVGITTDRYLGLSTAACAGLLCVGVLTLVSRRLLKPSGSRKTLWAGAGFVGVVIAASGLAALRHAVADRRLADDHVVFLTQDEPILATLRGRVISPPRIVEPRPDLPRAYPIGPKTRFVLETTAVAGAGGPIPASGKVAVVVRGVLLRLSVGDTVSMTGWFYRPPGPRNPGAYNWARHQRREGIHVGFSCGHAESVIVLDRGRSGGWQRVLGDVRARLRGYLLDDAFEEEDPGAGVMAAMVLGERSAVPRAMNEAFRKTGNAHFLAASGMHVGWLALLVWCITRLLGVYYRTAAVIVGLVILAYVVLAEPRPSILRAGIVGLILCLTICLRGRYHALNALSLATVAVLLLDPTDLFRPGFQYSFSAVLALLHLCPHVSRTIATWCLRMNLVRVARSFDSALYGAFLIAPDVSTSATGDAMRRIGRALAQLFALALSAWLITAPLSCYHFNMFTPWGWIQTLLLWFIALPVTIMGFVTLLLGVLVPSSGLVCGPVLKVGTDLMVSFVELLARTPGTLLDGRSPSIVWVLAVYAVLLIWVYKRHWIPGRHTFKVSALVLALWWSVPARWVGPGSGVLRAWMLDVGAGAGTVIELPNGQVLICDLGTRSPFDAGSVGEAFLRHCGIGHVDTIFVSHANFDHYSGIETLARRVGIGRVVINDRFEPFAPEGSGARRFLETLEHLAIPVEVTHGRHRFEGMGGAVVEALWPPAADGRSVPNSNESSTVLRISYQGQSLLLTGDIAEFSIGGLSAEGDIGADVLVLPHHGGVVHNTRAFISAVAPRVAIRSSAESRAMTTNGIEALVGDCTYFNTADDGCVLVEIRGGEVAVRTTASGG